MKNWKLRFLISFITSIFIVLGTRYWIRDLPISFGEITIAIFFLLVLVITFALLSLIQFLFDKRK